MIKKNPLYFSSFLSKSCHGIFYNLFYTTEHVFCLSNEKVNANGSSFFLVERMPTGVPSNHRSSIVLLNQNQKDSASTNPIWTCVDKFGGVTYVIWYVVHRVYANLIVCFVV